MTIEPCSSARPSRSARERTAFAGCLLAGLAVLLASCPRAASPPLRPNLLLVTFDTTRYDHFGCTGDPEARTPNVDALAARGLLFTRAYASVALTLPSHTTMLTGVEPLTHGVHNNGRFRVPDHLETLPERLRAHGYDTAAFVSAFVLDRRYNLGQGFDVYGDKTRSNSAALDFSVPTRPGEEVTAEALEWLAGRGSERPFFLWAHYYDPHLPRDVKPPFDSMPDAYAAEIAYADAQLGRLLEGVEKHDGGRGTFVIFTADHGESFGAHAERTHGLLAYDSTLHVPLVLAGPRVEAGARSSAYARHADLVPTVMDLLGLPPPDGLSGRSLLAAAAAGGDSDGVVGYFECRGPHFDLGWSTIEGVRTARWKYTASPSPPELYDIARDARELDNRIEKEPDVREEMEALYARFRAEHRSGDQESAQPTLAVEDLERLAALGYIEARGRFEPDDAPDPRQFTGVFQWVDSARNLASNGRFDDAIDTLETLVQSAAVRPLVLRSLAPIYAESGRYDAAVDAYRQYIELTGAQEARLGLARTLLRAGRTAEAERSLAEIPSRSPASEGLRAHALARLGRLAEARAVLDQAHAARAGAAGRLHARARLVIDVAPFADGDAELRSLLVEAPDDPALKSWLGYYLAVWGTPEQGDEAMQLLRAASAAAPDDVELKANLGWGAYRTGFDDEAAQALEAVLLLDRGRHLERLRLAMVLRRRGESQRALELVRTALAVRPGAEWSEAARTLVRELESEQGQRAQTGAGPDGHPLQAEVDGRRR